MHIAVAEAAKQHMGARLISARSEGAAKPRPRIYAGHAPDDPIGDGYIARETSIREKRHAHVVVGVIAHDVAGSRDTAGCPRICLYPAALHEEGGANPGTLERVEDRLNDARSRGSVRVFGVKREGDAADTHFSTPVSTIPRVKARWNIRKSTTGMIRVMAVPAWMKAGLE